MKPPNPILSDSEVSANSLNSIGEYTLNKTSVSPYYLTTMIRPFPEGTCNADPNLTGSESSFTWIRIRFLLARDQIRVFFGLVRYFFSLKESASILNSGAASITNIVRMSVWTVCLFFYNFFSESLFYSDL